eukprot:comp11420_c0_seq1/m.5817 comp11420_c0_seq1/g.5817  ORF comp11420_c0_seq1/g.5817 comp11420_c0_seq1/m.5817 type:complete len:697 (-) comp11420_c0_seq1:64-2154(-)
MAQSALGRLCQCLLRAGQQQGNLFTHTRRPATGIQRVTPLLATVIRSASTEQGARRRPPHVRPKEEATVDPKQMIEKAMRADSLTERRHLLKEHLNESPNQKMFDCLKDMRYLLRKGEYSLAQEVYHTLMRIEADTVADAALNLNNTVAAGLNTESNACLFEAHLLMGNVQKAFDVYENSRQIVRDIIDTGKWVEFPSTVVSMLDELIESTYSHKYNWNREHGKGNLLEVQVAVDAYESLREEAKEFWDHHANLRREQIRNTEIEDKRRSIEQGQQPSRPMTPEEIEQQVARYKPHIFTVRTYKNLITAVGRRDYEKAFGYLSHMEEQKLSPAGVYPTLIEVCLQQAKRNPIDRKPWQKAMDALRDMHSINRSLEGSLYAEMFDFAVSTHRAKDSLELLKVMYERSHVLDHGQLLHALCMAAHVGNAILAQELHAMAQFSGRIIPAYNLFGIIRAYVSSGVPSLAISVVESTAERGFDRQSMLHPSVALGPAVTSSSGGLDGIISAMVDYHKTKNELPTATLACVAQAFSSQKSQPNVDALKVFMSLFTEDTYKPLLKGLPGEEVSQVLGSLTRWQRYSHGVTIFKALGDLPTALHPQVLYRMLQLTNAAFTYDQSITSEGIASLVKAAELKKATDPNEAASCKSPLTKAQQTVIGHQLVQLELFAGECGKADSMAVLRPMFESLPAQQQEPLEVF